MALSCGFLCDGRDDVFTEPLRVVAPLAARLAVDVRTDADDTHFFVATDAVEQLAAIHFFSRRRDAAEEDARRTLATDLLAVLAHVRHALREILDRCHLYGARGLRQPRCSEERIPHVAEIDGAADRAVRVAADQQQ